jgi:hypothetical protein
MNNQLIYLIKLDYIFMLIEKSDLKKSHENL